MKYKITKIGSKIKGAVRIPASKSISNRLLIIRALTEGGFEIDNLSDSEDTKVLLAALESDASIINIGHAGTAMRFLTALYSVLPGERVLTGSDRMTKRPIGNLVEALNNLGAKISYEESEGFPPLRIKGTKICRDIVKIDGSISSQFISALLMIAPVLENGLELHLSNQVISSSYIEMTLRLIHEFGIEFSKNENVIIIAPQKYKPESIRVEGDWSGASYWYQLAALSDYAEIEIPDLYKNSLQGDSAIACLFEPFGIKTKYTKSGIILHSDKVKTEFYEADFINNPDMVQTFAVTCVLLDIPFRFTGTQSLRIKETDRILALQNELIKFGATLNYDGNGTLTWNGKKVINHFHDISISTYEDHRMALAFASAAIKFPGICIEDPNVVIKSYPNYWEELKQLGFEIQVNM